MPTTFKMAEDGQYYLKTKKGTTLIPGKMTFSFANEPYQYVFPFAKPTTPTSDVTSILPDPKQRTFVLTFSNQPEFALASATKAQLDSLEREVVKKGIGIEQIHTQNIAARAAAAKAEKGFQQEFKAFRLARLAKVTIWSEIIWQVAKRLFGLEGAAIKAGIRRLAKSRVKSVAKDTITTAAKQTTIGLGRIVSNIQPRVDFDTTRFDRALREYMRYTRKDLVDVVNQKAFWVAIGALKKTNKADRSAIEGGLDAGSSNMPGLTVGQALAISRLRNKGNKNPKKGEVNKEVRRIKSARKRAIGFLKSGWIPAVKILSAFAPSKAGTSGTTTNQGNTKPKGGAIPAVPRTNNVAEATIWNSIFADGDPKAHSYMVNALNESMNEQAADMEAYVRRKMERNAERFNRA